MESSSKIILVCLSLVIFIASAEAIQCISCQSTENKDCTDVLHNKTLAMSMSTDCGKVHDACMKIITEKYMIVKGKQEVASKIVSRFCAQLDNDKTKTGCNLQQGAGGQSEACYCRGNHCNGATISSISFGLLLMSVLTILCHQF